MNKKVKSVDYTIELTKEERNILEKASKLIQELYDFASENDIDIFEDCIDIEDYLIALDNQNETTEIKIYDSWNCPSHYTQEQREYFYK